MKEKVKPENEEKSIFSFSQVNEALDAMSNKIEEVKNNDTVQKTMDQTNEISNYINAELKFFPVQVFADNKCFDVENDMKECK